MSTDLETVEAELISASQSLDEARALVTEREATRRAANAALAKEITNWLGEFAPVTAEANARAFIASSQAERQALADGSLQAPVASRAGPSHLDRLRHGKLNSGPTALDRGYGSGSRRGAYDSSRRGGRVPSER